MGLEPLNSSDVHESDVGPSGTTTKDGSTADAEVEIIQRTFLGLNQC